MVRDIKTLNDGQVRGMGDWLPRGTSVQGARWNNNGVCLAVVNDDAMPELLVQAGMIDSRDEFDAGTNYGKRKTLEEFYKWERQNYSDMKRYDLLTENES